MGNEKSKLKGQISDLQKEAKLSKELKETLEARLKKTEGKKPTASVTKTPWREMEDDFEWSKEHEMKLIKDVEMYDTGDSVKNPRLLFVGPIGAGKSSALNSVATIDKGRIAEVARVGNEDKSVTTKLKVYRPSGSLKNFRILDTMGIEDDEGFNVDDINDLVLGSLKSKYQFNPRGACSTTERRKDAKEKFQVHCVVVVVDANNIGKGNLSAKTQGKIDLIRQKIKDKEIPLIILLTKVDILCKDVQCDITKVFQSKEVENAVKMAGEIFKVTEKNIHPVQNYTRRTRSEAKLNILFLLALRQMLNLAKDYLNELNMVTSSDEEEFDE